ncbi:TNFAIP3-interacting protein 1-like [Montipora foliosa]|uniref:TNFAIP3-interacting protein 1-like n=1 Tax=Montipora foliosa TaxID=591990 RepID=UPI0035F1419D
MSQWKNLSETPKSSQEEMLVLQKEMLLLQKENKALQIQAQGVQVLGKVLQEKQEDNVRLQKEVEQLKYQLNQNGVDTAQVDLSVSTFLDDDSLLSSAVGDRTGICHSTSTTNSSNEMHDYVHITTVSGPQSLSAGFPSLLRGEINCKEVQAEFHLIASELDQLIKETHSLCANFEKLPVYNRDTEIQGKLSKLSTKLNEYAKQARTRETLSSALVSEEEQIREKLAAMEEEQASHESVVQELKKKLDETREEIGQIQSEVNIFADTVLVEKGKEAREEDSQPMFVHFGQTAGSSPSLQSIHGKRTLLPSSSKTCEDCNQMQRQITEFQKQLLTTKAERDEAIKRKEEVLDVNHKWDAQYKMLVAATGKEISDLKEQVKVLTCASSSANNGTSLEAKGLEKKALEQQCRQLESELQKKQLEINKLQLMLRNLPGNMGQPPATQRIDMEQHTSNPSVLGLSAISSVAKTGSPIEGLPSSPGSLHTSQQIPAEVIDQIEVLKQQLRVYADDFASEREDRERNQAEKEEMREELNAVKEQVQTLEQQVQIYEEDFKREKREKESLQQQLRSNYSGGGYPYQNPVSQRARAVAEQEARVQAIREVHDRERDKLLRGQQELQEHVYGQQRGLYSRAQNQYNTYGRGFDYTNQDWQRQNQPLLPRGSFPNRGPITQPSKQSSANSMYHGGDVMPDRVEDVVDAPVADGNEAEKNDNGDANSREVVQLEECPRCLKKFNGETSDTIVKHIERCIS